MKSLRSLITVLAAMTLCTGVANAMHLNGIVTCAENGSPVAGVTVVATSTDPANPYQASSITDASGAYSIQLVSFPLCYDVTLPGETVVSPASGHFLLCADGTTLFYYQNFTITSAACVNRACWLTGGGAKFNAIAGIEVGEVKSFNWGGNINPGCSPTAGDGGSWTTIDNAQRLHFHGTHVEVLRCGNIDGIPPGSTSPVTPYNYIEFQGFGTLKGIKGNKADYGTVHFWGHIEDRNEPGSNGQNDGEGKDRIFMNVFTNPANPTGTSVMLVDVDGDPATVDPLTITDGNLQLHISSCSTPSAAAQQAAPETNLSPVPSAGNHTTFFGVPYPNPTGMASTMRFGVSAPSQVSLRVFDAAGRLVRELVSGNLPAGEYSTSWNLSNRSGARVGTGVYFLRLAVGNQTINRTITVTN